MSTPWEIANQAERQLREAQQARADVRDLLTEIARQRESIASLALWCSLGEHAFGSTDRKRTTFRIETIDEDTDQPVMQTLTACGPCSAKRKGFLTPQKTLPGGVDADEYRRYLEWKAGLAAEPTGE